DGAAEQTLAIALEDASYVTVFKTTDARAIASELAPGKGGRITRDIGQLIARREGIKVLVAGAIEKRGSGYRVEVSATDPASGNPIATTTSIRGSAGRTRASPACTQITSSSATRRKPASRWRCSIWTA